MRPSGNALPRRRALLGAVAVVCAGLLAPPAAGAPGGREAHVANPYLGARAYVDPQWRARALGEPGGERVAGTATGVRLDHVSAITGTADAMGLRAHLDAALAQGANLVQVVLDDLPGRDCTHWTFDGDFSPGQLDRYEREFVDPVVAIESDPRYGSLRIVNVVEGNALPQLVVGLRGGLCTAPAGDDYVKGVRYALDRLQAVSNLYTYLGIGGHAWLGWPDNATAAAALFQQVASGTAAGPAGVDGFISNLADYAPLTEPFLDPRQTVGGVPARRSKWIDWNDYADELSFVPAFRARLVAAGFPDGIGMLIDTSRNGWGGPARPTGPSTSTDVDTYVDASRVDRRPRYDEWCNQTGAGLGERPVAAPAPGIDAYVWMTPPGVSDGYYRSDATSDPGEDPFCGPRDPRWPASRTGQPTGALTGAPPRGTWFPTAFRQLMANAYPPLP